MSYPRFLLALQNICDHVVCSQHALAFVCLHARPTPHVGFFVPLWARHPHRTNGIFSSASSHSAQTQSALERAISVLSP